MNELGRGRRIGILLICSMSLLIVGLDVTIVNIALPSIGRDLHASVSGLQWTIDAYTLVLASLLMLSGSTADRLGRRKTFIVGLLTFVAGSLLSSLAPNLTTLVVFRMIQAIGGSMLNPVAMSIIANTFTDPKERAQAIGVWGAVVGMSMALGPVIGGLLVDSVGWRSIFWINIPIGLVAAALAFRYIPESRAPKARRIDGVGQALVIALLASLTYGIIEAPSRGWSSGVIIGAFAIALGSLAGLLLWEPRRAEPLIDLRFFRSIPFSGATVIAIAAFAGLGGFLFLNTLYLQDVRGLSPLHAGIDTLPMAAMALLFPTISGRIVGTRGARIPLFVAGVGLLVSCLMLVRVSDATPFSWLFAAYVVFGIGFGFVEHADHLRGRLGHATGPGRSGLRHRLHLAPDRSHVGGGRRGGAGHQQGRRGDQRGQPALRRGQPGRVVGPGRVRGSRARVGDGGHLTARPVQTAQRTAKELNPEFLEGLGR